MNSKRLNNNIILHMINFVMDDLKKGQNNRVIKMIECKFNHRIVQHILIDIENYKNFIISSKLQTEKAYILVISEIATHAMNDIIDYIESDDEDCVEYLYKYKENDNYLELYLTAQLN